MEKEKTFKEHEKDIELFLKERGWSELRPGDVAKSISIEAAELLELFQWENPTLDEVKGDNMKIEAVKKELPDVINHCFNLAVLLGLDTGEIVSDKLERVSRKYPPEVMKSRKNKEPGTDDAYIRAKKQKRVEDNQ